MQAALVFRQHGCHLAARSMGRYSMLLMVRPLPWPMNSPPRPAMVCSAKSMMSSVFRQVATLPAFVVAGSRMVTVVMPRDCIRFRAAVSWWRVIGEWLPMMVASHRPATTGSHTGLVCRGFEPRDSNQRRGTDRVSVLRRSASTTVYAVVHGEPAGCGW